MLSDLQQSALIANIILPILAIVAVLLRFVVVFRTEAGIKASELVILLALVSKEVRHMPSRILTFLTGTCGRRLRRGYIL